MFTLKKTFRFEAAHQLPSHDGACARLHGHSWRMKVVVQGQELNQGGPKAGMVEDFSDLSKAVKPLLDSKLDHYFLNETTGLENPTSEALAKWIYEMLKPSIPKLVAVQVDETCTSSCIYHP